MFCAPHDADVKLNDLSKAVGAGSGGLRFADEEILWEKLGLKQGSVTIFGLINDINNEVKLVLDSKITDGTYAKVYFHPMVNSATTGVSYQDINKFIEKVNHEPLVINVTQSSD